MIVSLHAYRLSAKNDIKSYQKDEQHENSKYRSTSFWNSQCFIAFTELYSRGIYWSRREENFMVLGAAVEFE